MNPVTHGLVLTVVGMGLVFLALGILLASMVALTRLFPARGKSTGVAADEAKARPSGPSEAELAAIGAALAVWLKGPAAFASDPQLGAALAAPPSLWSIAAHHQVRGGYNDR